MKILLRVDGRELSIQMNKESMRRLNFGKIYMINITQNLIIASQHDNQVVGKIIEPIHVWKPEKDEYEIEEIQENDTKSHSQEFSSGTDFIIERKMVKDLGITTK